MIRQDCLGFEITMREQERAVGLSRTVSLILVSLCVPACTSDPNAPINRSFPIRQMDQFFGSVNGPPNQYSTAEPDYTHHRGYAPAYPPYN
jgi:hypothetical protein